MMRHHLVHKLLPLTCACLLFATAFTPLSASRLTAPSQNTRPGTARLDSVLVAGSIRFTSEQIATAIGLHTGEIVGRDELQGAADKLAALGLFTNIQFRFSSLAGGVKVTYQVSDVPALPVTFDNFPWLSDEELSAGLKNSGILFRRRRSVERHDSRFHLRSARKTSGRSRRPCPRVARSRLSSVQ